MTTHYYIEKKPFDAALLDDGLLPIISVDPDECEELRNALMDAGFKVLKHKHATPCCLELDADVNRKLLQGVLSTFNRKMRPR